MSGTDERLRREIEARIARGWPTDRICVDLHCTPTRVANVMARLEDIVAKNPPRRTIAECGTRTGFRRHWNNAERACEPCREAERAYQAAAYRRRRAQRPEVAA